MSHSRNPTVASMSLPPARQASGTGRDAPHRRSIKTRVTLFTLAIFLVSIWAMALHTRQTLREDIEHLLSKQHLSIASILARDVNHQMSERLEDLQTIAATIDNLQANDLARLQRRLDGLRILQRHFNGGIFLAAPDGTVLARAPADNDAPPPSTHRSDAVAMALASGQPAIGGPHRDALLDAPVFHMAVPIRDAQGHVIGALNGVVNLSTTNFLDQISQNRFGNSGGYLLVDPRHRRIVTATDKQRIMEASPALEDHPEIARFLAGEQGSAIFTNPLGVEVLQSVHRVPVSGWYVAVALPTAEAFAPIRELQRHMLTAGPCCSVCSPAA